MEITNDEYKMINRILEITHLEDAFICQDDPDGNSAFFDFDSEDHVDPETGVEWMLDGLNMTRTFEDPDLKELAESFKAFLEKNNINYSNYIIF